MIKANFALPYGQFIKNVFLIVFGILHLIKGRKKFFYNKKVVFTDTKNKLLQFLPFTKDAYEN